MKQQALDRLDTFVTTAFVLTWIALMIGTVVANRTMGVEAKRRWFPRYVILGSVLFVFFATTLSVINRPSWSTLSILLFLVPACSLIAYLNLKLTRFCEGCGATVFNQNGFVPLNFCPKCGAKLVGPKVLEGDNSLE
ncbi:hypothetical protein [Singulisphaera sp. PoT]|uniref:hypothetical protein n=1 Tax=Singulisphaera sp. PoT TaxID=3411797 RepID=UPI003BF537FF